jgi:hypothetical protein
MFSSRNSISGAMYASAEGPSVTNAHLQQLASPAIKRNRIFLLSPANASGVRARLILGESTRSKLAQTIRTEGAALGDIFSFISGLYFRGKLTYSRAYANPPEGLEGVFVITASGGLISPDKIFTLDDLRAVVAGNVDAADLKYRVPLERDARALWGQIGDRCEQCEAVLLGSIATSKYVEPLLSIFGDRLMFPAEFVGRGDMSRGGLLLRCAREAVELQYVPVAGTVRHGSRPLRLSEADKRQRKTMKSQRAKKGKSNTAKASRHRKNP